MASGDGLIRAVRTLVQGDQTEMDIADLRSRLAAVR
jgi:hypothetical protein